MAETPTLSDNLKAIESANIHSSHRAAVARDFEVVKGITTQIFILDLVSGLPKVIGYSPNQGINEQYRQLGHCVFEIERITLQLRQAIDSLISEPHDAQDRQGRQTSFGVNARRFVEAWTPFVVSAQGARESPIRKELEQSRTDAASLLKDIKAARDAAKGAAGETAAVAYAALFESLASEHEVAANRWFKGLVGVAIAFAVVIVGFVAWAMLMPTSDYYLTIQIVVSKVVAISVLYFLLALSAKNYRSNLHLRAVNRYRAKALQSFEAFVASAKDDQAKGAVLLEATRCIYSHVNTGFIDSDDGANGTHIVEIMKAIGPTSGRQ